MKTYGVSTKLTAGGATELVLILAFFLLFSAPWYPTLDPAPPTEIWLAFSTLVAGAVGWWVPEGALSENSVAENE